MFSDVLGRLGKEASRSEARIIDAVSNLGTDHVDHGPDDVTLRVEFASVAGRVGSHILQQPLVEL